MRLKSLVTGLAAMFAAAPAIAQEGLQIIGVPTDKGLGFQPSDRIGARPSVVGR